MMSIISGGSIVVRSFEGAMPGDDDFATSYARLVPDVIRFEYQDDAVPHLPPSSAGRELLRGLLGFEDVLPLAHAYLYAHAGVLAFVDWSNVLVPDSQILRLQRNFKLGQQIVKGHVKQVIADHSIDDVSGLWGSHQCGRTLIECRKPVLGHFLYQLAAAVQVKLLCTRY